MGGSVGRAVASDAREPQFESRRRQNFIYQLYSKNRKDENKEKEAGNGPPLKKQAGKFRTETSQKFCSGKPKTLQPFFYFSSSMALQRVRGKLRVAK